MIPLLKIHFDTSRKTQFVINPCLLLQKCGGGAQYTNILLLTPVIDHLAVFFASGVMTFTAGEYVLFVLRSRTKEASLAP